jgi:hypothetical protein
VRGRGLWLGPCTEGTHSSQFTVKNTTLSLYIGRPALRLSLPIAIGHRVQRVVQKSANGRTGGVTGRGGRVQGGLLKVAGSEAYWPAISVGMNAGGHRTEHGDLAIGKRPDGGLGVIGEVGAGYLVGRCADAVRDARHGEVGRVHT